MKYEKLAGFSAENEEKFLKRLPSEARRVNLSQELGTQLAEDFGIVEFTLKYGFNNGKIVDLLSGQQVVELTSRGGVDEETRSIKKIEEGLKENPNKTWIHFSPKNEELGYPENCVDFWRMVGGEVVWNRMVVKNDFEEMNKVRRFLGEETMNNEMEMLASPVEVDLKLSEIFDLFRLKERKNNIFLREIEEVVDNYLKEFEYDFGSRLMVNSNLIFRLYSICFNVLKSRVEGSFEFYELEDYMYGEMMSLREEESFGCATTTTVGTFGEKIGYYVVEGKVSFGRIPDDFRECKKCGCWYSGELCPFC